MSRLETNYITKQKKCIELGDILKGETSNEVVVLIREEDGEIVVEDKNNSNTCYSIEEYLKDDTIEIVRSILIRPESKGGK
jgi:hypothetical protein